MVEAVVAILVLAAWGFVIGGLARFAVPGPDPMPWWLTIALGLVGSFLGGGVGYRAAGEFGLLLFPVLAASLLVIGYRRFVQRRGITGPEARRKPMRGFGIRRRKAVDHIAQLAELRDAGVLSEEEFESKKAQLIARGDG